MSNIVKEDIGAVLAWLLIGGAVFALLWNMLVVNHQRNVERDKYYAEHCRNVEKRNLFASAAYRCAEE